MGSVLRSTTEAEILLWGRTWALSTQALSPIHHTLGFYMMFLKLRWGVSSLNISKNPPTLKVLQPGTQILAGPIALECVVGVW